MLIIIDGLDDLGDGNGVSDGGQDPFRRLIGHGTFVNGAFLCRGGIDALHLGLKVLQGKGVLGFLPGTDPSCAVGRGLVPIGIAQAYA